jgi:hypothetical protein
LAFVSSNPTDFEPISPPHEPDAWYRVCPLSAGVLRKAVAAGRTDDRVDTTFACLPWLILSWSAERPITPENVDELDLDTMSFLLTHIKGVSNIRPSEERDSLPAGSSPTSAPAEEPSLQSSGIS